MKTVLIIKQCKASVKGVPQTLLVGKEYEVDNFLSNQLVIRGNAKIVEAGSTKQMVPFEDKALSEYENKEI